MKTAKIQLNSGLAKYILYGSAYLHKEKSATIFNFQNLIYLYLIYNNINTYCCQNKVPPGDVQEETYK